MRGIHNAAADGISRWDCGSVLDIMRAVRPNVPWQVRELGTIVFSLCTSVLASDSCDTPLRPRPNELTWGIDILAHGWTFGYVLVFPSFLIATFTI